MQIETASSYWNVLVQQIINGSYDLTDPPTLLKSYITATNFLAVVYDTLVFAYFKWIRICFCLFLNAFVSDLFVTSFTYHATICSNGIPSLFREWLAYNCVCNITVRWFVNTRGQGSQVKSKTVRGVRRDV